MSDKPKDHAQIIAELRTSIEELERNESIRSNLFTAAEENLEDAKDKIKELEGDKWERGILSAIRTPNWELGTLLHDAQKIAIEKYGYNSIEYSCITALIEAKLHNE